MSNPMDSTVEVVVKSVYGNETVYPANPQAHHLAAIAGTKTLTEFTLRQAKAMGFTIQLKADTKSLDAILGA